MKKRQKNKINGWLNIDKPYGLTSTQVIGRIRRILNPAKIGHAGTLDPLATGVLPIAMGEATKTISYMQESLKTYVFTVTWGEERDTDDAEGDIVNASHHRPALADVQALLDNYIGDIEQTPPQFSAIKINGQRAYDLARKGQSVDIKKRRVYIDSLELIEHAKEQTCFKMTCGKGTYVRAIARDLGRDLNCFGYISALRRIRVGNFDEKTAISLDKLTEMPYEDALERAVLPLESALDDIPALPVTQNEATRLRNG
jgi:tRNA pseudouridine55 synthase